MSQGDNIKRENDYFLNFLKIVDWKGNEYDFTSHFAMFSYEETIWGSPHGTITCVDSIDYPTLLPIIGEERIKASFTRPDETKEDTFLPELRFDMPVYAMSGKQQSSGSNKLQTYSLQYISDGAFKSVNSRAFKAYKGKIYSDIVQEIYDGFLNFGKPIEIEKTLHEMDYVINNERPHDAIKKIAKRSISEEGNGTYYTLYEDRDSYYYMTVAKMFDRPVSHTFRYEPKNLNDASEGLQYKAREFERNLYNVSSVHYGRQFDVLGSAMNGEATSSLLSINPIRRKFIEKDFDLRQEFDQFKHVDSNKKWSDANKMFGERKANLLMIVSNIGNEAAPYIIEREPAVKPFFFEDYKLHRRSQSNQIKKHVITVSLSGDPRVRAGAMVEFQHPEFLGKTNSDEPEELDRYLQGKYLVAAVSHTIKQGSYTINLELLKDTYFKELLNRDPLKEYDNKL